MVPILMVHKQLVPIHICGYSNKTQAVSHGIMMYITFHQTSLMCKHANTNVVVEYMPWILRVYFEIIYFKAAYVC